MTSLGVGGGQGGPSGLTEEPEGVSLSLVLQPLASIASWIMARSSRVSGTQEDILISICSPSLVE